MSSTPRPSVSARSAFGDRLALVVDDLVGADRTAVLGLLLAADHRDDARAENLRELHRGRTAAAGRTEHRECLAGLHLAAGDEADPARDVRDVEARRVGVAHRVGNRVPGAGERLFGESALPGVERGDGHDPVADRVVDAFAHRGDLARDLLARREGERRGEWVDPAAHQHVGKPECRGLHPDPHLAGAGLGELGFDLVERRGWFAVFLDLPCAHDAHPTLAGRDARSHERLVRCDGDVDRDGAGKRELQRDAEADRDQEYLVARAHSRRRRRLRLRR